MEEIMANKRALRYVKALKGVVGGVAGWLAAAVTASSRADPGGDSRRQVSLGRSWKPSWISGFS
jgi:hypothetical protein